MNGMSSFPWLHIHQSARKITKTGNATINTAIAANAGSQPAIIAVHAAMQASAAADITLNAVSLLIRHQIVMMISITRRKISSELSEHMITYGAPGARNISAFAA